MPSSKKNYKQRAKNLKSLGLLPSNYRLSKLGESEKRHIRRIEQGLRNVDPSISETPEKFLSSRVPPGKATALENAGYVIRKTKRGKRFIAERQHSTRIRFDPKSDAIIREFANRRSITYPLESGPETLERIRRFFNGRKKNQYLTFRIGGKAPFNIAIGSLADFNRYVTRIQEEWKRREEMRDIESPMPYLQIVEVTNYKTAERKKRK